MEPDTALIPVEPRPRLHSRFLRWLCLGVALLFRRSRWVLTQQHKDAAAHCRYRLLCEKQYKGVQVLDLLDVLLQCDFDDFVVAEGATTGIGDVQTYDMIEGQDVAGLVMLCQES